MKEMLMGIENEFTFQTKNNNLISSSEQFSLVRSHLNAPYFKKGEYALRLSTGGAFYLDGDEPEITTAPYFVETGSVTAVTSNLIMGRNLVVQAIDRVNQTSSNRKEDPLYLDGYSAHYNFSFPEIDYGDDQNKICLLLSKSVNPALQLLVENKKSSGIMYRNCDYGRFEICADYMPGQEDMIAAVGFQAAMFSTIRSWVADGMDTRDMMRRMKYALCVEHVELGSHGYIALTPDVIQNGRDALVKVRDRSGHVLKKTAQELLLHYAGLFEEGMDKVLTKHEKKIVLDSVHKKRSLPIDGDELPLGYKCVKSISLDESLADAPLKSAFANAVVDRLVSPDLMLRTQKMSWESIRYAVLVKPRPIMEFEFYFVTGLDVELDHLVQFETMLEKNPDLFRKIISGKVNSDVRQALVSDGFDENLINRWDLSQSLRCWEARNSLRLDESISILAPANNAILENVVIRSVDEAAKSLEAVISPPISGSSDSMPLDAHPIQYSAEPSVAVSITRSERSDATSFDSQQGDSQ